ncbi:single-stranded DNA-binding protein [Rothia nasimurium]|uniref:single-stranded DNA-binding protein n=1 Tax=Rothia nasimurium TaxID=85336 RepID=UPI001F437660|nr:single-stranded DNA-binding protein [Rothia nasimurium]
MANDTQITIIGNLVADAELRFTPNGAAVANFTIASTPRVYDRATNEWKEGETLFLRARIWREAAENVAATLKKGMRVIAQGKLKAHSYETKEGERRTGFDLEVEEVGPSLRFASAQVLPNPRGYVQSAPPVQQGGGAVPVSQPPAQAQGQHPQPGGNQAWGQGAGDETTPF